jgi:superfamily I DNA/RNA helicase
MWASIKGPKSSMLSPYAATGGPNDEATNILLLLTLQWAKGLEFVHVFLPNWENRVFPPAYATTRRNSGSRMSRSVAA